jgi:hypothetical protein
MVGHVDSSTAAGQPSRRVILIGASNLTRGIVDTCHRLWGQPLDVLAALGHGRSYGTRSTVLGRSLPSILHCDLWPALRERSDVPTAALVTDIGNDLLYEAPVERIVEWVTRCLDNLIELNVRTVMTRLPVANIEHVSEWKFRVIRRLSFPKGRSSFATIAGRARELDQRLLEVASARGIATVEQQRAWYGWDPIHLTSRSWPAAWHKILSPLGDAMVEPAKRNASLARMIYLRTRTPRQRWWFGIEQRGPQPCGRLAEGSVVSFY